MAGEEPLLAGAGTSDGGGDVDVGAGRAGRAESVSHRYGMLFQELCCMGLLLAIVVGTWLSAWFGGVDEWTNTWRNSCHPPDGNEYDSTPLQCDKSSSSQELLTLPLVSGSCFLLFMFLLVIVMPAGPLQTLLALPRALTLGSTLDFLHAEQLARRELPELPPPPRRSRAMAVVSAAVAAVGSAVIALWLPSQNWHDFLNAKPLVIALGGLSCFYCGGWLAFHSTSMGVALASTFSGWFIGSTIAILAADNTFNGYPRYEVCGVLLVWVLGATLAARLAAELLLLGNCNGRADAAALCCLACDAALVMLFAVLLMWEIGYSIDLVRFVPVTAIITLATLCVDGISKAATLAVAVREQKAARIRSRQRRSSPPIGWTTKALQLPSEQDRAPLLSKYTFWWVTPSLRAANSKNRLDQSDLPTLPIRDRSALLYSSFCEHLHARAERGTKRDAAGGQEISSKMRTLSWTHLLWMTSFSVQKRTFCSALFHGWLFLFMMLVDPIMFKMLMDDASSEHQNDPHALIKSMALMVLLTVSMFVRVTCMEVSYFESMRVNNNIRTVLATAIFRKTLRSANTDNSNITTSNQGGEKEEHTAAESYDAGTLTNLMATDADKLGKTSWMMWFMAVWTWSIASLPVILYCLHQVVGDAAWVGVSTFFWGGLLGSQVGRLEKPAVRALQERRDERSQLMKEILYSVTVIKLQAWEDDWRIRVAEVRKGEMQQLRKLRLLQALVTLIGTLLNAAVPISIFTYYTVAMGKNLDATTAFVTLSWISQMNWSIQSLPGIFNMLANVTPSCERIAEFLGDISLKGLGWVDGGNKDAAGSGEDTGFSAATVSTSANEENSIVIGGPAKFGYCPTKVLGGERKNKNKNYVNNNGDIERTNSNDESDSNVAPLLVSQGADCHDVSTACSPVTVLCGVELMVSAGSFVIIAGAVGSGKSTLLAGMAKAMSPLEGYCNVSGSRAFVSQHPFLLNESIRSNILFGKTFNAELYTRCITNACLTQDLAALPAGDETVVGESGVQLSGGQKARVAVARALYSQADCYFLDDILSAVDATTGQRIWNQALTTMLRSKTVVLVTHQLQYLSRKEVDHVVILDNKKVALQGTWKELAADPSTATLLGKWAIEQKQQTKSSNINAEEDLAMKIQEQSAQRKDSFVSLSDSNGKDNNGVSQEVLVSLKECEQQLQMMLDGCHGRTLDGNLVAEICAALRGDNEHTEHRREGLISWRDFRVYLDVFGSNLTLTLLVFTMVLTVASNVGMNVWLSVWGDADKDNDTSHSLRNNYLYVYIGLGVFSAVANSSKSVMLTLCALHASKTIHWRMLNTLLGAAMSFFDRTTSGQVMNRFLQDLANVDNFVPNAVLDQSQKSLDVVSQVLLVIVFAPWVLFSLPFVLVPYFLIFGAVRCAARDTRRLEAVAHSPVYTQFADVLRGQLSIRAFAAEPLFEAWNEKLIDAMSRAKYANEAVSKWAQTLTTQNGCLLYFVVGMSCVVLVRKGSMSTGQLGLIVMYAANLQRAAMDYMVGLTNLESQFVSVERVAEFLRIPNEFEEDDKDHLNISVEGSNGGGVGEAATAVISAAHIDGRYVWPSEGALELRQVKMRYALHRPLVLNGLTFAIKPKEKVALCGTTGCGKSSTFGTIARLYPIAAGDILVDGRSIICDVSLREVRRSLRFVTQASILVQGTLRSNLSTEDTAITDMDMWSALEKVHMAEFVKALPGGLDCKVEDGGKNFSVGERQLLCTARGLLPWSGVPPKLLFFDEVTANIDLALDEKIHDVLLGLDATVLMICHRLQHIKRFDRVVVLGRSGTVVEQGSPDQLIADPTTQLFDLFRRAGLDGQ